MNETTLSSNTACAATAIGGCCLASVTTDAPQTLTRLGDTGPAAGRTRDAGRLADEVLAHLAALPGSKLRVSFEIEAEMPEGAPEHVRRTVSENARVPKFETQGFEPEQRREGRESCPLMGVARPGPSGPGHRPPRRSS